MIWQSMWPCAHNVLTRASYVGTMSETSISIVNNYHPLPLHTVTGSAVDYHSSFTEPPLCISLHGAEVVVHFLRYIRL